MAVTLRVLAVCAHPDDAEFGCGGTLARWADEGADVTLCIVTDGSTGTQDTALVGERLAEVRRAEAEEAARVLGVARVVWLGYRDGYVEYTLELRRDIARVFRRVRPHRYLVMDPSPTIDGRFVNHPDHRAVGQAALDVTLTAGTTPGHFPELLEEGLRPWRGLRELYVMGPGRRPVAVDIEATVERKIAALLCHRSQVGDDAERIAAWVRDRARATGEPVGLAYAESFQVITQGPGFHPEEAAEEAAEMTLAEPPSDPSSAPVRRNP